MAVAINNNFPPTPPIGPPVLPPPVTPPGPPPAPGPGCNMNHHTHFEPPHPDPTHFPPSPKDDSIQGLIQRLMTSLNELLARLSPPTVTPKKFAYDNTDFPPPPPSLASAAQAVAAAAK